MCLILNQVGYNRVPIRSRFRPIRLTLCYISHFELVYISCLMCGLRAQLNTIRGYRSSAAFDIYLNLIFLIVRTVKSQIGFVFARNVLPEVVTVNVINTLGRNLCEVTGEIPRCVRLVETHIAGIDSRVVMKDAAFDIDAFMIYQLERLICLNCMCERATAVGSSRFLLRYRHNLICNEFPVVVQAHAEEVRISFRLHIVISRIQFGFADAGLMLFIEENVDIVIYAVIFLLSECRSHDMSFTCRVNRRR